MCEGRRKWVTMFTSRIMDRPKLPRTSVVCSGAGVAMTLKCSVLARCSPSRSAAAPTSGPMGPRATSVGVANRALLALLEPAAYPSHMCFRVGRCCFPFGCVFVGISCSLPLKEALKVNVVILKSLACCCLIYTRIFPYCVCVFYAWSSIGQLTWSVFLRLVYRATTLAIFSSPFLQRFYL